MNITQELYTVFQHFMDELKHCNLDMQMDLQLLVPVFLCLYSIYLVKLPFRMTFFHNVFCLSFSMNLQYFSPLLQDLFAIFNENLLLAFGLLSIIQDSLNYI